MIHQVEVDSRMDSSVISPDQGHELSESLSRIVVEPGRIESLHQILGPFCHESRNLLNILKMSLYLVHRDSGRPRSPSWDQVDRQLVVVEQFYDRMQLICRPVALSCVRLPLGMLIEDRYPDWLERFRSRGRLLKLVAPRGQAVGHYDPHHLGRAIDGFVNWRADAGAQDESATLRWSTRGGSFQVEWIEAPADEPHEGEVAETAGDSGNDPLALPLLGRIVAAHGGSMKQLKSSGRHVQLTWPQVFVRDR